MPRITTFITYVDQAEDAAKFYCSVFKSSRIVATTHYGDNMPGKKGSAMTVELELDGTRFVFLNGGDHFKLTDAASLMVDCKTQDEIDYYATKLSAGGGKEVACGWVTDKFGLSWQIVPAQLSELISDSDPKRSQRVMEAVMQMNRLDIATMQTAYAGT